MSSATAKRSRLNMLQPGLDVVRDVHLQAATDERRLLPAHPSLGPEYGRGDGLGPITQGFLVEGLSHCGIGFDVPRIEFVAVILAERRWRNTNRQRNLILWNAIAG